MKKRVLSMVLALIMLIGVIPICAESAETEITVYLSVSKNGEIVKCKDGTDMACAEVTLSGKASYHLDDVFLAAHLAYHEDGSDGYASSVGDWGLSVDKLWGDTSYNFGYQVNGGAESVSGLSHPVENGDYVDACIYQNAYPDTEGYARFDMRRVEADCNEAFALTLSYVSGYDENWNSVFSPCEGATITINGEESEFITDENGMVSIKIEDAGCYTISATKSKVVKEETVPAITAPVCVAEVKTQPAIQIMHNIAGQYAQCNVAEVGGNLPWMLADMAVYEMLFPDSQNKLTDEKREAALKEIVAFAKDATKPGDLAKSILALRALGYDARKVYAEAFEKVDVVEKLTTLVDNGETAVTNIYTLPYVMIALSQAENYATEAQMEYLIHSAVESAAAWQDVTNGTDAMTPMLLALAPHASTNEQVQSIIHQSVEILKGEQREDGLIDGFAGYESASTGLAICAFSAIGIDVVEVVKGENHLIDGLLSTANEEKNGFSNAFATEQGFRGLLAWQLLSQNKGVGMYDFSDFPRNEANISGAQACPVIFEVAPSDAVVVVDGGSPIAENSYDMEEGSYSYSVSASGYQTQRGTVSVTEEEAQNHTVKKIVVSLLKKHSGSSIGGGGTVAPPKVETEPQEPEQEPQAPAQEEEKVPVVSVDEVFSDVGADDWYYPAVQYVYENRLFQGTGEQFEPNANMSRAMLVTVLYRLAAPVETAKANPFTDVPEQEWYTESVKWAVENEIIFGISDTEFAPNTDVTREQIAMILYRYASLKDYDINGNADVSLYCDAEEISEYAVEAMRYAVAMGIISGRTENLLAPQAGATRAEVATMLMRFAGVYQQ